MNEWDRLHKQAEKNKKLYPAGTRIEMDHMNDPFAPIPNGTKGTVVAVDDIGQLIMKWDNGQKLVLSIETDIEITVTDSSECFDDNKLYLMERMENEPNLKVRGLLEEDIDFLDAVQMEMSTARQFIFTARCRNLKPSQVFKRANEIEKTISEHGFEVHRMKKSEIKRFLALYFDASMLGEQMPDADGEQLVERSDV